MSVQRKNCEQSEGWGKYPTPEQVYSDLARLERLTRAVLRRMRCLVGVMVRSGCT